MELNDTEIKEMSHFVYTVDDSLCSVYSWHLWKLRNIQQVSRKRG